MNSFKRLIHSETSQLAVLMNGPLNHWLTRFIQTRVNWLSLWMGHWIIDSLDSFKRLIHSETSQLSVLMNGSLNHWLTRFIQTTDSFRNESIVCPYEWATESLTHAIHSNGWFIQERVNCLSLWMGHWIIDSLDSFKRLIHSETSQLSVLMNGSLNHWLTRFIQTTDSFRNESIVCPYEWATESLTHSIHSNTWIRSETKHRCMLLRDTQQFCCVFDRNYCRQRNWAKTVNILFTSFHPLVYWKTIV